MSVHEPQGLGHTSWHPASMTRGSGMDQWPFSAIANNILWVSLSTGFHHLDGMEKVGRDEACMYRIQMIMHNASSTIKVQMAHLP